MKTVGFLLKITKNLFVRICVIFDYLWQHHTELKNATI